MTPNLSMFAKSLGAAVLVSLAVSVPARADTVTLDDPLHGYCGLSYSTSPCTTNGVITPFAPGALSGGFGFASDPNALTGTDWLIAILVPSNLAGASTENFTVSDTAGIGNTAHSNVGATGKGLFSSGDLGTFLGLPSFNPNNPFNAFTVMNDSGVTGFYVYLADLGATTLQNQAGSNAPVAPILTLGGSSSLLPGMEITSFLEGTSQSHPTVATAPSSVLLETGPNTPPAPVPEPSSLLLFGSGLVGLAKGMARRRQR